MVAIGRTRPSGYRHRQARLNRRFATRSSHPSRRKPERPSEPKLTSVAAADDRDGRKGKPALSVPWGTKHARNSYTVFKAMGLRSDPNGRSIDFG